MRLQLRNVLLVLLLSSVMSLTFTRIGAQTPERSVQAATGSIAGKVVETGTGRPLQRVSVRLSRVSGTVAPPAEGAADSSLPPPRPAQRGSRGFPFPAPSFDILETRTETAIDGTFVFSGLPTGSYVVWAVLDHYMPQEYGQRLIGGKGRPIGLSAGAQLDSIDFQLIRKGSISGTLTDQNGVPRAKAEVQALMYRNLYDGRTLMGVGLWVDTDDQGRYRLDDLDPGEYLVMARPARNETVVRLPRGGIMTFGGGPNRGGSDTATDRAQPREVFPPSFYPAGNSDPAQARAIRVFPAAEIVGIDFALRAAQSGVITGTVTPPVESGATGQPFSASVTLEPLSPRIRGNFEPEPLQAVAGADGKFQFNNVVPGVYRVVVASPNPNRKGLALQDVDILPGSTQTLTLALQSGVEIQGRVIFDDPFPPGFDCRQCVALARLDGDGLGRLDTSGRSPIERDGTFVLKNLVPGVGYRVSFANIDPRNGNEFDESRPAAYIASARYGNQDLITSALKVGSEKFSIEAHVGFGSGRVEIFPADGDRRLQGIQTTLVRQGDNRDVQSRISDDRGRAVFPNLRPGDYRVFAWEEIREGVWLDDPAFFDRVEASGRRIHIENGATITETIPIIKLEKGDWN